MAKINDSGFNLNPAQYQQAISQFYSPYAQKSSAINPKKIIIKPTFASGGGGLVLPKPGNYTIKDPKGNVVDTGNASGKPGEAGIKVHSDFIASGQFGPGYTLDYGGNTHTINTGNTGDRYDINDDGSISASSKGAAGTSPGAIGAGGVAFPADISGLYPTYHPAEFNPIDSANYNFTDPTEFAKKFGDFNRGELDKNFGQAKGFALQSLDTELQGLQNFVPAAAALKRQQTSVDNAFNQQQRTSQVNQALPGVGDALNAQGRRAASYASGQLPDSFQDRQLELGIRSGAADAAGFGGFGARSSQSNKLSDLQSAETRFQIAQYGEGLTTQNIGTKANLFLAPTEYANVGQEVRSTPEVGAGRLTYQGLGAINEATLLSPGQALSTEVNQQQFKTNLDQQTNMYNASNEFDASKFNSANQFTADIGLFNYRASLSAAVTAAQQQQLNNFAGAATGGFGAGTGVAGLENGQNAQTIQAATQAATVVGTGLVGSALTGIAAATGPRSDPTSASAPAQVTSGGAVGGSASAGVSTAPNNQVSSGNALSTPSAEQTGGSSGSSGASRAAPIAVEPSSPGTVRFASAADVPSGYTPVSTGSGGQVVAANNSSYSGDLERFAKFAGAPSGSISIPNAVAADQQLSASTGLSYQPLPKLQQVALTPSGSQVYSTPPAANNGDFTLGAQHTSSLGMTLATLGIKDDAVLSSVGHVAEHSSSPEVLSRLDQLAGTGDTEAVAQHIIETVAGGELDPSTNAGQQIAAGAGRIAELWPNLSPAQKSLALSSLAAPVIDKKSGVNIGDLHVPGSEKSVAGKLPISAVTQMMASGQNGIGLARNWGQLSALGAVTTGANTPEKIQQLASSIGFLGHGPQGAAVAIDEKQLREINAHPAPAFGVGAITAKKGAKLPQGYKAVTSTPDGRQVAIPENLTHTTPFDGKSPLPLAYKNSILINGDKHPAQKNWGPAPNRGIVRGSVGGSAFVSGMHQLQQNSPVHSSAMTAYSMFSNTHGVG